MQKLPNITIRHTIDCSDRACWRQQNYWGEFTSFGQIDLAEFEQKSSLTLERLGWFLSDGNWFCSRHKEETE